MTNDNNVVTTCIQLLDAQNTQFFHDERNECYASIQVKGVARIVPLHSSAFEDFATKAYFQETKRGLKREVRKDLLATCSARARYEGPQENVHIRVAPIDPTKLSAGAEIDIGDDTGQCVRITGESITITNPTRKFLRPDNFKALPRPEYGGDINALFEIINVDGQEDRLAVISFILGALLPNPMDYPIFFLTGEQGSGKSTATELISMLIDPRTSVKKAMPKSEQDIAVMARRSHLLTFDNLSFIKGDLADVLCRISTGGSIETRKLYTDADVTEFDLKKPVILNSIVDVLNRQDLLDRSLTVELPSLAAQDRVTGSDLRERFEKTKGKIFGAICRAMKAGFANYESTTVTQNIRSADFGRFAAAAAPGYGNTPNDVMQALLAIREKQKIDQISVNPVCRAIDDFISTKIRWNGAPTELYNELTTRFTDENPKPWDWPKTVESFSGHLNRQRANIEALDIDLATSRSAKTRMIHLVKRSPKETADIIAFHTPVSAVA